MQPVLRDYAEVTRLYMGPAIFDGHNGHKTSLELYRGMIVAIKLRRIPALIRRIVVWQPGVAHEVD